METLFTISSDAFIIRMSPRCQTVSVDGLKTFEALPHVAASAALTPVSGDRPAKKGILQNVRGDFREKAGASSAGGHTGD